MNEKRRPLLLVDQDSEPHTRGSYQVLPSPQTHKFPTLLEKDQFTNIILPIISNPILLVYFSRSTAPVLGLYMEGEMNSCLRQLLQFSCAWAWPAPVCHTESSRPHRVSGLLGELDTWQATALACHYAEIRHTYRPLVASLEHYSTL